MAWGQTDLGNFMPAGVSIENIVEEGQPRYMVLFHSRRGENRDLRWIQEIVLSL